MTVPLRNEGQLLIHELYDPASPQYRGFLTVQQFTEQCLLMDAGFDLSW